MQLCSRLLCGWLQQVLLHLRFSRSIEGVQWEPLHVFNTLRGHRGRDYCCLGYCCIDRQASSLKANNQMIHVQKLASSASSTSREQPPKIRAFFSFLTSPHPTTDFLPFKWESQGRHRHKQKLNTGWAQFPNAFCVLGSDDTSLFINFIFLQHFWGQVLLLTLYRGRSNAKWG